ncbi:transposase [Candidatus Kaiserbacteria bacterium]|nr:transposase [Candidatus Kaiserbacteria bacterium]
MPNHFHLVLRERNEKGITEFIRKVCTGYSMYFNLRHDHSGTLFQGKFRSNHIDNDPYFKWIFAYVHLNPIALVDPNWEEKDIKDTNKALTTLNNYRYSSFYDFYTAERPERNILAYNETLHYIDRAQEIGALVRGYRRGSSLYPTFTPNRA